MPKKTKTRKATKTKQLRDGMIHLSALHLAEWRASEAETRLALQTTHALGLELEQLVAQVPAIVNKRAQIIEAKKLAHEKQKAHIERMDDLGREYGFDPKKVTINDETGQVTILE